MRRARTENIAWLFAVILSACLLGGTAGSADSSRPPRTVVDFYMLLPRGNFEVPRRDLLAPHWPHVVDVRNGYLHVRGGGAQNDLTVCIFKRPAGSYLVALSNNNFTSGGDWHPTLRFFSYRRGRLVDVTRAALPRHFSSALGYKLPRYGRTIRVITPEGRTVYSMDWADGSFNVTRAG